jgi:hypothetical protein
MDTDDNTDKTEILDAESAEQSIIDIHDMELLKKLWFTLKSTQNQAEVFALVKLLVDSLPYEWIDKNENLLLIAQQLDQFGESELASLFKLANQRCFQLSLKD